MISYTPVIKRDKIRCEENIALSYGHRITIFRCKEVTEPAFMHRVLDKLVPSRRIHAWRYQFNYCIVLKLCKNILTCIILRFSYLRNFLQH